MKHLCNRPLIGISVGTGMTWRRGGGSWKSYSSVIEKAGGVCVRLGAYASMDLAKCDGLLVPGGWDVHPMHYERMPGDQGLTDEEVMARYGVKCEPKRDETELAFIRAALDAGKPVLAICRGIQALNVALARKLIPDIPRCVPNALRHRSPGIGQSLSHEVEIEAGSLIESAYGTRRLTVNTRHHQGMTVDMIPDTLRVTAIAADGVVEAVEGVTGRFVVGAQWHPERKRDPFIHDISGPLFEAFVKACGGK